MGGGPPPPASRNNPVFFSTGKCVGGYYCEPGLTESG